MFSHSSYGQFSENQSELFMREFSGKYKILNYCSVTVMYRKFSGIIKDFVKNIYMSSVQSKLFWRMFFS